MGRLEFISDVIMGIGMLLIVGQLTGYLTSSIGVLGYVVGGGVFAFGLILYIFVSKKKEKTE
ncbi:MAG: hypothetical protein E4H14_15375 [Candidatus Thorarchaeota archaeon]|nr:MAG: hypothetical protein E4H14_15375 [Candidatus Thorarchaeota archaeon]